MLLFVLCLPLAHAQIGLKKVSLGLLTESISFPFTRMVAIHPGFELGAAVTEKDRPKSVRTWSVGLGYFYHREVDVAVYAKAVYTHTFKIKQIIGLSFPVGIGYMHSFHAGEIYRQQPDGSFAEQTQTGKPHALLNAGLDLSYLGWERLEPFTGYDAALQSPFASTIPVLPRSFLKVGIRYRIQTKDQN